MSSSLFDKILKIVQVIVTVLQFALKSFFDYKDDDNDDEQTT